MLPRVSLLNVLYAVVFWVLLAAPAAAQVAYNADIEIAGPTDKALLATLQSTSQLVALKNRLPPTDAALRRRAEEDLPQLKSVMEAEGYWQASIAYQVDTRVKPAKVTITVTPGPLFHFDKITFETPSGAPAPLLDRLGPAAFGLVPGSPARSASVEAANTSIVETYAHNGHPFAKIVDRQAVIDVGKATMAVTYSVDPGAAATFGPTEITGLKEVDRDFVERRIAWKAGTAYDDREVERTRQDLVSSGLFASVRIGHADTPDSQGRVAMTITLIEGPPHSIGGGVGYNTNIRLGANAFWEDRNLFGDGEDLRLSAGVAQRQLGLDAAFRRPDLFLPKLDLVTSAEVLRQETDAYTSRREQAYGGVEERMWPPYTLGGGLLLDQAYVTSEIGNENYVLLGVPLYLRRDTTDDLLNPTIGSRLDVTITPFHGLTGPDLNFIKATVEPRFYQRISDDDRMVLATYGIFGSITGASLEQVPLDQRLYAGGAGSVRAYAYQRAGPLDADGNPTGGRSTIVLGTEFRYRFTETLGIVPFFEGGNVYPSSLPNSVKLFYGAGLGFRYYTAIGPIRVDFAFPLERRPGDSIVQVYISLGQAF